MPGHTHTHTHTQSVCPPLFGNLYFSLSPFAYLSARTHTHTHVHVLYIHIHRDSNYNRTHHSDRLLVFWLSKQILKTLFSKPMLLLKARSSSSDVLRDISSKVQVASNIWFSWDINLGTKCTNIHCSWPVCEWRWYQCSLETTFHGYTRHLPSWDLYVYYVNLKLLYTKWSLKTLFCWVLDPLNWEFQKFRCFRKHYKHLFTNDAIPRLWGVTVY